MRMKRAAALGLVLCLLLTGCAVRIPSVIPAEVSEEEIHAAAQVEITEENIVNESESGPEPEPVGFVPVPWYPSVIEGYMKELEPPMAKDDFYASVNYDWMRNSSIEAGRSQKSTLTDMDDQSREKLIALFSDEMPEGHDAVLVHDFYTLFSDIETRNALGVEVLRPYVDKLESIESTNQLSAYLLENPPFGLDYTLLRFAPEPDPDNSRTNSLVIYPGELLLEAADEYDVNTRTELGRRLDSGNRILICGILSRLGYTEKEATDLYERAIAYEALLAENMLPRSVVNAYSYSIEYATVLSGKYFTDNITHYPLIDLLWSLGITDLSKTIVREPEWLEALDESFTPENLEGIKSYLLCHMIKKTAGYLDEEALSMKAEYEAAVNGTDGSYQWENVLYSSMNDCLCEELSRLYLDKYVSDEMISDVESIVALVLESYRIKLQDQNWLSDATTAKAIEKLDNLSVFVGGPGAWSKNAGLNFDNCEDLAAAYSKVCSFHWKKLANYYLLGPEKGSWDVYDFGAHMINGFYDPGENSINILGAIMSEGAYDPEASIEYNLACIGIVIAHEISHAFDDNGAQYDELGNLAAWWTEEDMAAFNQRTALVAAFLDKMEPMEGVFINGELQCSELIADLSGMSAILCIAQGIEGFNYDLFFRSYAEFWRTIQKQEIFDQKLTDPHCPAYVRVNAVVQQFDEFLDTYGITSEDGMYLSETERVLVW